MENEDNAMNVKLYWENIIGYFEEEDWPLYEVNVWLHGESETLSLSWYFQSSAPSSKRHLILNLLNTLNYKLIMGKFAMNPEDGGLAFRISASVTGTRFSTGYFESLWNWGIWRADEHYPKFMSLIYGDHTVDEVLEGKVEVSGKARRAGGAFRGR
ncbi:MAG: hypothetical protein AMK69_29215 [Nitrospira bacterium SG8_3]|nr:MAG: hypothetical protein AMK69_29215 [Nitrospira bacterium SG8_3]